MTQDELADLVADLDTRRWHIRRVNLTEGRIQGWHWLTIAPGTWQHRIVRHWKTHAEALDHATPKRRR